MLKVKSTCPGCGLCLSVCPTGALKLKKGRVILAGDCVECGLCLAACPVKALTLVVDDRREVNRRA